MARNVRLQAARRSVIGKQVNALRRAGQLPAVIYGRGVEPTSITMDLHSTGRSLRGVSSSTLITIDLEGKELTALVRERQYNRLKNTLIHVDFLAVAMDQLLRTNVPLRLVGEAPVIKLFAGMVMAELEHLEIEALPGDLPEVIEVDVSTLSNIGDSLHVRDLTLPAGVTVLNNPGDALAVALAAQVAEEVEEVPAEVAVEPELIERRAEDEEEDEDEE